MKIKYSILNIECSFCEIIILHNRSPLFLHCGTHERIIRGICVLSLIQYQTTMMIVMLKTY